MIQRWWIFHLFSIFFLITLIWEWVLNCGAQWWQEQPKVQQKPRLADKAHVVFKTVGETSRFFFFFFSGFAPRVRCVCVSVGSSAVAVLWWQWHKHLKFYGGTMFHEIQANMLEMNGNTEVLRSEEETIKNNQMEILPQKNPIEII